MNLPASAIVAGLSLLAGCQTLGPGGRVQARLEPGAGSSVHGLVSFVPTDGPMRISGVFSGLRPNADYAIDIREDGDCTAADGSSAGRPADAARALPGLRSDAGGRARYQVTVPGLQLQGDAGILGRALVLHRPPAAGSGDLRLACGLIDR